MDRQGEESAVYIVLWCHLQLILLLQ